MAGTGTRIGSALALVIVTAGLVAACGADATAPVETGAGSTESTVSTGEGTTDAVTIAEAYHGFEYYGACGNEAVDAGGVTFYPLLPEEEAALDIDRYHTELTGDSFDGMAPILRVEAPGPGDDIGTMLVYADGVARFESDSGRVIWLTDAEHVYAWEC